MAKMITEQQVKDALQIDSFRNLSKEKIMEFASLIPNMDKDVAISIINQFPAYAESSRKMLEQFKNVCDAALENNKDSQKDAILAYRKILDDLGGVLKKEELTPEERNRITEQMLEVADRISAKDTENKQFIDNLVKYGTQLTAGALLLGAVILGVNVKGINLPRLVTSNEYLRFLIEQAEIVFKKLSYQVPYETGYTKG